MIADTIVDTMAASAFLAMAYVVNDLSTATEDSVVGEQRTTLMIALLSGALVETLAIATAPLCWVELNYMLNFTAALCLLALPAVFWPVARRLREGRAQVLNRRLEARARRAEAAAEEARFWLAKAEQAGHVGHWRLAVPGQTLTWSDEVFRIHGLWHEHYRPRLDSALAAFHPLDGARIGALLREVMEKGGEFDVTAKLRRPDGEIRNVVLRAQALRGRFGDVEAVQGVMVDVTETRRAETHPPAHAGLEDGTVDELTGLLSRKQFDASLGYEFKRAVRSKMPLGLVLIEIDQFARYTARHGRKSADACLRGVGEAVRAVPRRTGDLVARYSKTEIAVLLPLADAAGAECVAQKIAEAVRALALPDDVREGGLLTLSGGAAAFSGPDDLYNPQELTRRATQALADARLFGGDQVCRYRETEFTEKA
ncbi:GGDEF domain-containing protein [Acidocella aromatica]|uniref:diguanylate cyclase n=1 Tax=Acidocella aromatica TaxID=1303579 RepID=A0A840VCP8_9PROT|nr:sensor domain-containing diguanylate cyclase [Acidocella aromatica]MBB5372627.1 diguanylate cyclase (GGDEF)-like protein [Acidocella aromatica]